MSTSEIMRLSKLQEHSGKRLRSSIIHGFGATHRGARLVNWTWLDGELVGYPKNGAGALIRNPQRRSRVVTFTQQKLRFMKMVNLALKGGKSYPVLTAVLGTAAGVASGGAGMLFTAASTAISLGRRETNVLARKGDEVWLVEEVGRRWQDNWWPIPNEWVAVHISAYFLIDPYRDPKKSTAKGWLIHENRTPVRM